MPFADLLQYVIEVCDALIDERFYEQWLVIQKVRCYNVMLTRCTVGLF